MINDHAAAMGALDVAIEKKRSEIAELQSAMAARALELSDLEIKRAALATVHDLDTWQRTWTAAHAILDIVEDAGQSRGALLLRLQQYLGDLMGLGPAQWHHEDIEYDMGPVSAVPDLGGKDFEDAVELVLEWFRDNFEDPVENTPWESAEGGYQFVWGGPYDAREEIEDAFDDAISEAVLEEAVKQIEHDGWEWAPSESRVVAVIPNPPDKIAV